jgi:D-alanyl-D-alanine carboxypeptidase (penicillin-binding protein 5/6)
MRVRVGAALLVIIAAAAFVNYVRPVPTAAASPSATFPSSRVIPGTAPSLPWPARGSGAVGVSGLGFIASSGNEQTIPAASVTKVMTGLVLLRDKPLKKGETGPNVTLTDVDVQSYNADLQAQQSVVKVEAGEPLSEYQLLEGMLIPSANNFAETLARWDAGSIDAFVTRMNTTAASLHLSHSKFADPAGASPNSASTPSDLLKLGMIAMQDPVFAEIVAKGQANLPVAGTVYNVNAALSNFGIVGIKTGSGFGTGANFLFAANASVDGHTVVIYGCVVGQPTLGDAFSAAERLIAAMTPALHVKHELARNDTVGVFTTAWGDQADIVSVFDVDLVEWPGMVLRQRLDVAPLQVDKPLPSSTQVGKAHFSLGDYDFDVSVATGNPLYPPGRFWRLTRITI